MKQKNVLCCASRHKDVYLVCAHVWAMHRKVLEYSYSKNKRNQCLSSLYSLWFFIEEISCGCTLYFISLNDDQIFSVLFLWCVLADSMPLPQTLQLESPSSLVHKALPVSYIRLAPSNQLLILSILLPSPSRLSCSWTVQVLF